MYEMDVLYTVEQVELIRRLRLSGITARQIIEAFNELDRVELELGSPLQTVDSADATISSFGQISSDIVEMVDEFMSREDEAFMEMRDYVSEKRIKQHRIAGICGISQPYVSKLLNGSHREVSARIRRISLAWYAQCLKNGGRDDSSPELVKADINDLDLGLKRERFMFKPLHNKFLKTKLAENPYPNLDQRLALANDLNSLYADSCGKTVSDLDSKEIVTEHLLATWFTNKRRETKMKGLPISGNAGKRGRPPKRSLNNYVDQSPSLLNGGIKTEIKEEPSPDNQSSCFDIVEHIRDADDTFGNKEDSNRDIF